MLKDLGFGLDQRSNKLHSMGQTQPTICFHTAHNEMVSTFSNDWGGGGVIFHDTKKLQEIQTEVSIKKVFLEHSQTHLFT